MSNTRGSEIYPWEIFLDDKYYKKSKFRVIVKEYELIA